MNCGTEYITLNIYLCPVYQALYTESLMVLNNQYNNPECFGTADWAADPPVLKFIISLKENSLSSCNNTLKVMIAFPTTSVKWGTFFPQKIFSRQ